MVQGRLRVLMCRFDLDGHDRGFLTTVHALRDAGAEVICIHFSNPREIVQAAIQEYVNVIGITSSLGQHLHVSSILFEEMKKEQLNIPVVMGGVIPAVDIPRLMSVGVSRVFGPGSKPQEAASFVLSIGQR